MVFFFKIEDLIQNIPTTCKNNGNISLNGLIGTTPWRGTVYFVSTSRKYEKYPVMLVAVIYIKKKNLLAKYLTNACP